MAVETPTVLPSVQEFSSPPKALIDLLNKNLPSSLTIVRRLQYTSFPLGTTPAAKILFTSPQGTLESSPDMYTVAYLDISGGPDTQMWIYSTIEAGVEGDYSSQFKALVAKCIQIRQTHGKTHYPDAVLLGSLNTKSLEILNAATGRADLRPSGIYDKWIFELDDIPYGNQTLPEGMHWGTASIDDCRLVASRTDIPRPPEMLVAKPNLMIKLEDETPIAWAFLGPEASLISVHCEEPYRRRGLSRMTAAKILKERVRDYGEGLLSSADVSPDNVASRAMCASLGGKPKSQCCWVLLRLHDEE